MVLGFMQRFPSKEPTFFKEKILAGKKIHTIREDKNSRWKAGNTIQMAYGVRTTSYDCFNACRTNLERVVSVQAIEIYVSDVRGVKNLQIFVDDKRLSLTDVKRLIENDGLTPEQFFDYFKGMFKGKLIHWTDLKY